MNQQPIFIGSDHAAFEMKSVIIEHLKKQGYNIQDLGTHSLASCDYPHYSEAVARAVIANNSRGILICGSGIGISIAANKLPVRCGLAIDGFSAARASRNCNILAFGARIVGIEVAKQIVDIYLQSSK